MDRQVPIANNGLNEGLLLTAKDAAVDAHEFQQDALEVLAPPTRYQSNDSSRVKSPLRFSPVVVRLAGLSGDAVRPLASLKCRENARAQAQIREELVTTRAAVVAIIEAHLADFEKRIRGYLLRLKRDCFNGRPVRKYVGKAGWLQLCKLTDGTCLQIVALEDDLAELVRSGAEQFQQELERERRHVLSFASDTRFLRGIALGQPDLVKKVRSRRKRLEKTSYPGLPKKWEVSLLRYVTRAATKLSANSTLTAYGMGAIWATSSNSNIQAVSRRLVELSVVRMNRPQVEQITALLLRRDLVRDHCHLQRNDSLVEIEPGSYQFVKDGSWGQTEDRKGLRWKKAVRVTASLNEKLLEAAEAAIADGDSRIARQVRDRVIGALAAESLAEERELVDDFDQLLELGALLVVPPWPSNLDLVEVKVASFLRDLLKEPGLEDHPDRSYVERVSDALAEYFHLSEEFAESERPEETVYQLREAVLRVLRAAIGEEVGVPSSSELETRPHFYEDVHIANSESTEGLTDVVRVNDSVLRRIYRDISLVHRFTEFYNTRHDLLHTLAEWWRLTWPSRAILPLREVANSFAPIWSQYRVFLKTAYKNLSMPFNPLELDTIEELSEQRRDLILRAFGEIRLGEEEDELPLDSLAALASEIPGRYSPLVAPGAFAQPIDSDAQTWVLNQIYEGTGRFLARYTTVLQGEARRLLTEHLRVRSVRTWNGEEAHLLDLLNPVGELFNSHPLHTEKVLRLRGVELGVNPDRCTELSDLQLVADLDTETFRVVDKCGRSMIPVNLSSMQDSTMAPLLHFLASFGPGETRGILPFAKTDRSGEAMSYGRLRCGNLILHRRRWDLPVSSLRELLQDAGEESSYCLVQDWCRNLGLPRVGYFAHARKGRAIKPQLVDFSSPSLCRNFVSAVATQEGKLMKFVEALPRPPEYPLDHQGKNRAMEFLIDGLAICAQPGNSSVEHSTTVREFKVPGGKGEDHV